MSHQPQRQRAASRWRPQAAAVAIGLLFLLPSAPARAAGRGTAQNPIFLPGTEIVTPRQPIREPKDRATLRRGSFEATLYRLPSARLLPGLRPRLTAGASVADAVVRGRLGGDGMGDVDLGTAGLRLSVDPSWAVEIEGRDIGLGEFASPATLVRTRGSYPMTQFGVEVSF